MTEHATPTGAAPAYRDPAGVEAPGACAGCARLAGQVQTLERQLAAAKHALEAHAAQVRAGRRA